MFVHQKSVHADAFTHKKTASATTKKGQKIMQTEDNYLHLPLKWFVPLTTILKAYFQPWCNARRDPISCNKKFLDYWKPSKIVFLKSHPGLIVNCYTVNTFTVRHFTVSLQHF